MLNSQTGSFKKLDIALLSLVNVVTAINTYDFRNPSIEVFVGNFANKKIIL